MLRWKLQFILLIEFICSITAEADWGYHGGTKKWGLNNPYCSGNKQSPIKLNSSAARDARDYGMALVFSDYFISSDVAITNTGHTVQMDFRYSDSGKTPTAGLKEECSPSFEFYRLKSGQFHWPSEHWIDNEYFPLELQLEHEDVEGKNHLLFISLLYHLYVCDKGIKAMDDIMNAVSNVPKKGDSATLKNFPPISLWDATMNGGRLPTTRMTGGTISNIDSSYYCNYFVYDGSLTTPPCTEDVKWLVYNPKEPLCLDEKQYGAFEVVTDNKDEPMIDNNRPIQPLRGRPVSFFKCDNHAKFCSH